MCRAVHTTLLPNCLLLYRYITHYMYSPPDASTQGARESSGTRSRPALPSTGGYAVGRPEQHQPPPPRRTAGAATSAADSGAWPSSIAPISAVANAARLNTACSAVCGTTCTRVISPAPILHADSSSDSLPSSACSPTISRRNSGATRHCSPIAWPSRSTVQPSEIPPSVAVAP